MCANTLIGHRMANDEHAAKDLPEHSGETAGNEAAEPNKQADDVSEDDPHKTEKLAQAGRDLDTEAGNE